MVRMLWLGWLLWRRLESMLDGYKLGLAARSQALSQGVGLMRDLLEPYVRDWLMGAARSWGN